MGTAVIQQAVRESRDNLFSKANVDNLSLNEKLMNNDKTSLPSSTLPEFEIEFQQFIEKITLCDINQTEILNYLIKILKIFEKNKLLAENCAKEYTLIPFINTISRFGEDINIAHCILKIINLLVEYNKAIVEESCLRGYLKYIRMYSGPDNLRELRVETAYFIGQMFTEINSSIDTVLVKIFIASDGVTILKNLLDIKFEQGKELIIVSIDCIYIMVSNDSFSPNIICDMLVNNCIPERLVLSMHGFGCDSKFRNYLGKIQCLLLFFAERASLIPKIRLISKLIFEMHEVLLDKLTSTEILHFTSFIKVLSNYEFLHNALENIGIINCCLNIMIRAKKQEEQSEKIVSEIVGTLINICNSSNARCEQTCLNKIMCEIINYVNNVPSSNKVSLIR